MHIGARMAPDYLLFKYTCKALHTVRFLSTRKIEWNAESLILTSNKSTSKLEMAKIREIGHYGVTSGVKKPLWVSDIAITLGGLLRIPWGIFV